MISLYWERPSTRLPPIDQGQDLVRMEFGMDPGVCEDRIHGTFTRVATLLRNGPNLWTVAMPLSHLSTTLWL